MSDRAILERVCALLGEHASVPVGELGPSSGPHNTEGWDSMANLGLFCALEEEFGVTFSASDAMGLRVVADIVAFLERHARGPSSRAGGA